MTAQPTDALVRALNRILADSWKEVWTQQQHELAEMFEKFGDRAYGAWIQKFMAPVFERIAEEGYQIKAGFNRRDSLENWGPPEERERCAWYVMKNAEGHPLCTLVLQVYHSHAAFHIPRPPRLIALDVTDRPDIIRALSQASVRVRWDLPQERLPDAPHSGRPPQRWEYATDISIGDCTTPDEEGQLSSWLLDESLAHWGRYGWELVDVSTAQGKMIAFFKRPALD